MALPFKSLNPRQKCGMEAKPAPYPGHAVRGCSFGQQHFDNVQVVVVNSDVQGREAILQREEQGHLSILF